MDTVITSLSKSEKTKLVLHNITELPPIPKVIREALKLLDADTPSIFHLSKVIAQDQSLVTKIMAIANSPFYGLQRKVANVDFALTIVGISEVRNIVSTLTMLETFKNKTDKYLDQKEFWQHSFLCGLSAKKIAEDLNISNTSDAFIAGFLHEIGVSVIHRFFHSSFTQIYEIEKSGQLNFEEAEIEVLGMTHAEIGHELLDKWNFPFELCQAVLNHHHPENSGNMSKLAALLNLLDYATVKLGIGDFSWDKDVELSPAAIDILPFEDALAADNFIAGYEKLFREQLDSIRYLV